MKILKVTVITLIINWFIFHLIPPLTHAQFEINSITPNYGLPGTEVLIQGDGFQPGQRRLFTVGAPILSGPPIFQRVPTALPF
jgi:hypothetical protein